MDMASLLLKIDPQWLFWLGGIFFVFFLFFLGRAREIEKKPLRVEPLFSKLIYTDQKEDHKEKGVTYSKLLYAEKYGLKGKPDLLFQQAFSRNIVPVEIKSGMIKENPMPHQGDLLQLAAYFLIVEETYHVRPKYGRLVYKDYMFQVKNTRRIRKEVKNTLAAMRTMLRTGKGQAEPNFAKCRYCVCNQTVCEYAKKKER